MWSQGVLTWPSMQSWVMTPVCPEMTSWAVEGWEELGRPSLFPFMASREAYCIIKRRQRSQRLQLSFGKPGVKLSWTSLGEHDFLLLIHPSYNYWTPAVCLTLFWTLKIKQDSGPVLMEHAGWWGEPYRKSFTGIPQRSCPLMAQGCPEAWLGAFAPWDPCLIFPQRLQEVFVVHWVPKQ